MRLKVRIVIYLKTFLLFAAIILIFSSCGKQEEISKKYDLTQDERVWMEQFFKTVMIDNSSIYTLWGSKPVTSIPLLLYTQEEMEDWYNSLSEEEKKEVVKVPHDFFSENWQKWEKISSRFPMGRYRFFKKEFPEQPKVQLVYFIDIAKVALTLEKHYDIFKRCNGMDFDPIQEAFNMSKGSEFWDNNSSNQALIGLLYGFGLQNSLFFDWRYNDKLSEHVGFQESLQFHFSDTCQYDSDLKNLKIPVFATYSLLKDPIIKRYQEERREIQKIYRGKDFLDFTLQQMTSGF